MNPLFVVAFAEIAKQTSQSCFDSPEVSSHIPSVTFPSSPPSSTNLATTSFPASRMVGLASIPRYSVPSTFTEILVSGSVFVQVTSSFSFEYVAVTLSLRDSASFPFASALNFKVGSSPM